jgi:ATP-binding cassette subfamily B protein
MEAKKLAKQIKAKNRASNIYVFISSLSAVGTSLLTVLLVHLYGQGELTKDRIWQIGAGIAALQIAKAVFYAVGLWRAHDAAYRSLADLRLGIVGHLKKLPLGFFQKRRVGDLSNVVSHDVEQLEIYLAHAQPEIAATTGAAAIIAAVLFVVDWRLALCLLGPVALAMGLLGLLFALWGGLLKQYNQATKEMSENLMEYVGIMPAVKAFSTSETRSGALISHITRYAKTMRKFMVAISAPQGVVMMILQSGVCLVILFGIHLLTSNDITVTRFVLGLVLSVAFSGAMIKYMTYEHAGILLNRSAENIAGITSVHPSREGAATPTVGDIIFESVTFSYDEREDALKNVSVVFKQGSVNAIVGESGSGKSTIANLIMAFWTADKGCVTIGGADLKNAGEDDIARLVSIVQQESFLYNTTHAENIGIGKQGATRDEIMKAAKKACIHDMISSLPQGYDTICGEGGARLSGGEKQRIAIARAILKDAPIVILDEATAAIDPYNEQVIQQAITNMSKGKTLIVIAHHLTAIRGADRIIVMEAGRVAGEGTHGELLKTCPLYAEMTAAQESVDNWDIKTADAEKEVRI